MKLDSQTSLFWSIFLLAFAKYREQTFGRDNYEYFFLLDIITTIQKITKTDVCKRTRQQQLQSNAINTCDYHTLNGQFNNRNEPHENRLTNICAYHNNPKRIESELKFLLFGEFNILCSHHIILMANMFETIAKIRVRFLLLNLFVFNFPYFQYTLKFDK